MVYLIANNNTLVIQTTVQQQRQRQQQQQQQIITIDHGCSLFQCTFLYTYKRGQFNTR